MYVKHTKKPGVYRDLTAAEQEHVTRLLWKCSQRQLATVLGVNHNALNRWIIGKAKWPEESIVAMMALTTAILPPKPKKQKPQTHQKIGFKKAEPYYYQGSE